MEIYAENVLSRILFSIGLWLWMCILYTEEWTIGRFRLFSREEGEIVNSIFWYYTRRHRDGEREGRKRMKSRIT